MNSQKLSVGTCRSRKGTVVHLCGSLAFFHFSCGGLKAEGIWKRTATSSPLSPEFVTLRSKMGSLLCFGEAPRALAGQWPNEWPREATDWPSSPEVWKWPKPLALVTLVEIICHLAMMLPKNIRLKIHLKTWRKI